MSQNAWAALLLRNFRVGSVVYTWCDFCTPPKNKFLVIASTTPRLLVLVINTNVNQFYIDQGLECYHVKVPVVDHDFLKYDSYNNCVEAISSFDISFMQDEMLNNYGIFFKGWLADNCLSEVYDAVSAQNVMRRGHKREIMASMKTQLGLD